MRRITIALMTTISGLVLLFSYHTSTNSSTTSALPLGGAGTDGSGTGGADAASTAASPSSSIPSPSASPSTEDDNGDDDASPAAQASPTQSPSQAATKGKDGTYAGATVDTQWGPVQVKIVVKGGKIVAADVLKVPMSNHHDVEINTYAVPQLNQRVLDNQSANFDAISGATVTSDGYKQSLQTALDKAHL